MWGCVGGKGEVPLSDSKGRDWRLALCSFIPVSPGLGLGLCLRRDVVTGSLSALSLACLLLLAPGSPRLQLCLSPRSRLTLTLCIQLRPVHGRHQVSLQTIPETERHSLKAVPRFCPMSGLPLPAGCPPPALSTLSPLEH